MIFFNFCYWPNLLMMIIFDFLTKKLFKLWFHIYLFKRQLNLLWKDHVFFKEAIGDLLSYILVFQAELGGANE